MMNRRTAGAIGTKTLFGVAIAMLLVLVAIFAFSRQSPSAAGAAFMSALAKGDSATLSGLSYLGDTPPAEIELKWKRTLERSRGYLFAWRLVSSSTASDGKSAAVRLQVTRNAANPGAYEEKFELPMVQRDGKWLVEVDGISREMFPFLPRPSGD